MKVIIPMSGQGKRFLNAGYKEPKPLISVDEKPIIQHVIELFPGSEIHCICNSEHIETTDMKNILVNLGAKVHVINNHSLGPVYAVSKVFDVIEDEEEIIVSYCDYGTVWNFKDFTETVTNSGADGAIPSYRGFHPHMLGTDNYAFLNCENGEKNGWVREIREKEPFTDNKMGEYASNGTYYFKKGKYVKKYFQKLLDSGEKGQKNGEFYVSLVYNLMIQDNLRVQAYEIEKMLQWGTPHDLEVYKTWSEHFKRAAKEQDSFKSCATLVLPMAGAGSRFKMVGYEDPKPFLKVNGESMIIRAVESIPECEDKIFICLNEHLEKYPLKESLSSKWNNAKIVGIDKITEGQACTCAIGINVSGIGNNTAILISACDNGVDYDIEKYKALENDEANDVIVWSFNNNPTSKLYPHMYAWLDVDENNNIRKVSVKKYLEGATQCIIGTMFFRKVSIFKEGFEHIVKTNTRTNGEFYVDDILNVLIEKGYKVKSFLVDSYICWGTPTDYKIYQYWYEHFSKVWGVPHKM